MAKILVKDIGLANLPSLTKLSLNDGYKKLNDDVLEYLSSENAQKLKVLALSRAYINDSEYIRILQQVQKLALQELFFGKKLWDVK